MFSLGGLRFSLELWSGMPYFSWHELPLPFRNLLTVTNFESDERDRDCEYHFETVRMACKAKTRFVGYSDCESKTSFRCSCNRVVKFITDVTSVPTAHAQN